MSSDCSIYRLEDTWASLFLPGSSVSLWEDQPAPTPPQWSCIDYIPTTGNGSGAQIDWDVDTLQMMYQSCHVPTLIEEYRTFRSLCLLYDSYTEKLHSYDTDVWFLETPVL